ncbi:hypothetical protein QE152_g33274 [Popillia japonica]|uniref:CCHC-type domain-containing protein n=1 Tax=Popillia japonica TaxID=7064 RepID=A0AAW1IXW1_POPJA
MDNSVPTDKNKETINQRRSSKPYLPARNEENKPLCFACKKYGHVSKYCSENQRQAKNLGSQCIMTREADANELNVKIESLDKPMQIRNFGGAITTIGKFNALLKVDQARAETEILVVPNSCQKIPLVIGQLFTEKKHISGCKVHEKFHGISEWVKGYSDGKNVNDLPDRGSPQATTKIENGMILRLFEKNPHLGGEHHHK